MSLSSVRPEVGPVAWPAEYCTSWPIFSSSVIFCRSSVTLFSRTGDSSGLVDAIVLPRGAGDCAGNTCGNKVPTPHNNTKEKIETQLRKGTLSLTLEGLRSFMAEMIAPLLT